MVFRRVTCLSRHVSRCLNRRIINRLRKPLSIDTFISWDRRPILATVRHGCPIVRYRGREAGWNRLNGATGTI
jgi:hypothetical protein